jgi:hypothetical protein
MRRDDSFEAGRVVRPHIDYIYCVKRIANFGSPGEFENQIAIVLEQAAVTDVLSNNVWGPPWESNNDRESPATQQRPELSEHTS